MTENKQTHHSKNNPINKPKLPMEEPIASDWIQKGDSNEKD